MASTTASLQHALAARDEEQIQAIGPQATACIDETTTLLKEIRAHACTPECSSSEPFSKVYTDRQVSPKQ